MRRAARVAREYATASSALRRAPDDPTAPARHAPSDGRTAGTPPTPPGDRNRPVRLEKLDSRHPVSHGSAVGRRWRGSGARDRLGSGWRANLDRLTAGEHRDRRWKGVPGRHLGVKHEHRDDLDAVRDRGFSPEPDELARVVDALAAALSVMLSHFGPMTTGRVWHERTGGHDDRRTERARGFPHRVGAPQGRR